MRKVYLLLTILTLCSCQITSPPSLQDRVDTKPSAESPLKFQLQPSSLPIVNLKKATSIPPKVEINMEKETDKPGFMKVHFTLTMPTPKHIPEQKFTTQAVNGNQINFVKLEISGAGISTPIYANGADVNGLVPNAGGTYTLTISNVPYGNARIARLTTFDATQTLLPGAEAKSVFNVNTPNTNIELSYRTTLTAQIIENIQGSPENKFLAEQIDLTALQTFVDNLIGVSGVSPNYTYTLHPTLAKPIDIANDLIAVNGDTTQLNATNPSYQNIPGQVQITISGLIGPDTVDIFVNDPASTIITGLGNGTHTLTGVLPGNWQVFAIGSGYVADSTPNPTILSGASQNVGTVNMSVAVAPTITSLSVGSGITGTSIQINGNNFHTTTAGNIVRFGTVSTSVTAANSNQLTVNVPGGTFGNENVTVSVGGQTSNTQSFSITPNITNLNPTSGNLGSTLLITGTGFDGNTATNNIVRLNGVSATVNSASNSLINVTIPNASNGNVTVQVGTQTSNGIAYNVLPTISLSAPANNALINGNNVPITANVTSGNTVTQVEFFDGVTSLGIDTTAPYSINWNTTATTSGPHTLTARITDAQTNSVTSSAINVTVNQPPVINSITPTQNPVPGLGYPIQLTANVTDSDNTLNNSSYTWSCDGGCGSFNRTDSNTVIWTAPTSGAGPYTIRLSVTDGVNPAVVDTQSITVTNLTADVNIESPIN